MAKLRCGRLWVMGAAAMLVAGGAAAAPAAPAPVPAAETPAPGGPPPSHAVRYRHRHHFHKRAATQDGLPVATAHPAPAPDDHGFSPAPTVPQPVEGETASHRELMPAEAGVPKSTDVSPGTVQLHYPFAGDGYVTGSSPQAMDDATTAKIPGVIVKVPIQPKPAQALPPP